MASTFQTKSERKRNRYFKERGLVEPPFPQGERLSLAQKFYDDGDYETALMLFDRIMDYDHPEFLNLVGKINIVNTSPFYDLEEAEKYFRKAFRHFEGSRLKQEISDNLISVYANRRDIGLQNFSDIFSHPYISEAILDLASSEQPISILKSMGQQDKTRYLLATSFASGRIDDTPDHEKDLALYAEYFDAQDEGFLKEVYQNIAIRYALGLGCIANPQRALRILQSGQILLSGKQNVFNPALYSTLKRYAEGSKNAEYALTAEAISKQINKGSHPFGVVEFIQDIEHHSPQAVSDALFMASLLAHAENWKNFQYWPNMAHAAAKEARVVEHRDFDFSTVAKLGSNTTFDSSTLEIEGKTLELSAKRLELHDYFRKHKLGIPPKNQEERLAKALAFINQTPANLEAAYMLFDEEQDSEHPSWLANVAFILDMHLDNESLFDPKRAYEMNVKAASLGSGTAAFNLGVKFHTGQETEIDLEQALKWYRRADELHERLAKGRIAKILKLQTEIEDLGASNFYSSEVIDLYEAAYKQRDIVASVKVAEFFINGVGRAKNPIRSLDIYKETLNLKPSYAEESAHAQLALTLAVRSYLGFDLDRDHEQVRQYLNLIPDQSNHSSIRYYYQEWKTLFKSYIDNKNRSPDQSLTLVQRLYTHPEEIQRIIQSIDSGEIDVDDHLVNYVACAKWLASNEDWPSQYDWNDLAEAVQARQLSFTFNQAVQSTRDSGPRYNALDERGMPILGSLMKPSAGEKEEINDKKITGSYVPQPGLIKLRRIEVNAEGFKYYGAYSEDLPAMITEEDRQISEILAFGDTEKGPLFPSLSLETENNDKLGKGAEGSGYNKAFTYKIFDPQWLAHTDFGRTLWITDYLIGQWCWNPEKFKIGNPENCSSPDQHFKARDFIQDLRLTGGRDGGASSARVMIQPKSNYIIPEAPKEGETVYRQDAASVDIKQMTMKVYGSYILNDGNTENRSLFEEDPNFAQGRTVEKLTDRYNEIMQLDPRFERAQQLMGLFYGHVRLWQNGYRPSEALQQNLTAKLRVMEKLGRDKDERLLVRRSFGLRPY